MLEAGGAGAYDSGGGGKNPGRNGVMVAGVGGGARTEPTARTARGVYEEGKGAGSESRGKDGVALVAGATITRGASKAESNDGGRAGEGNDTDEDEGEDEDENEGTELEEEREDD